MLVFNANGTKHKGRFDVEMHYRPGAIDGDPPQPPARIIKKAFNRAAFRTNDPRPEYMFAEPARVDPEYPELPPEDYQEPDPRTIARRESATWKRFGAGSGID